VLHTWESSSEFSFLAPEVRGSGLQFRTAWQDSYFKWKHYATRARAHQAIFEYIEICQENNPPEQRKTGGPQERMTAEQESI